MARDRHDARATTKVAITLAVVVPLLFLIYEFRLAGVQPIFTVCVVPIAGLILFAVRLLPEVWEPRARASSPVR